MRLIRCFLLFCTILFSALPIFCLAEYSGATSSTPFFRITIVDDETSRGIPLVRLTIPNKTEYYTDSAGVIAFLEPELMGQDVLCVVDSFGYQFGSGQGGPFGRRRFPITTIKPEAGSSVTLTMHRVNIAQRLYRMTGADIYRDSMILGDRTPTCYAPLAVSPMGQDSVDTAIYKGKLVWIWGDTLFASNFMGNFRTTGATSELPSEGGMDPERSVYLDFFQNDSKIRPMVNMQHSPIWLGNLRVANDMGRERLFANYVKVVGTLETAEKGLVEFNDETEMFDFATTHTLDSIMYPEGFACFQHREKGKDYYYYLSPWPCVRSQTDPESIINLGSYEAFTCLKDGSRFNGTAEQLDRDKNGNLRWQWRKNTSPVAEAQMAQLVSQGAIEPEEAWYALCDIETSETITSHNGSVFYNPHRNRWISIRGQRGGSRSEVGEIFYFEADTPLGPWVYGRRIVTHYSQRRRLGNQNPETYTFYNPYHHVEFDKENGRIIYFEGTYTEQFSGNPKATPRYDYNQIMYKMDLNDCRLFLPVPVYRTEGKAGKYRTKSNLGSRERAAEMVFFAPDRMAAETVPVYQYMGEDKQTVLTVEEPDSDLDAIVAFYAPPGDLESLCSDMAYHAVLLYEYKNEQSKARRYAPEGALGGDDWIRAEKPVCWVWPTMTRFNPLAMTD